MSTDTSDPAQTVDGFRCAVSSLTRDEPIYGTASSVSRWLLVEQPGAWSSETIPESRLGADRVRALRSHAEQMNARLLLIRRPQTSPDTADARARRLFFADSRPASTRLYTRTVADESALDDLPLTSGWTQIDGPMYAVCAHGAKDTCCALQGRPIAAELARLAPDATWECTHLGGDRFAGNVLVLPEGLYYGRVLPQRCAELVTATDEGDVVVDLLRGRSCFAPAVQVAQHFARRETGAEEIDTFAPLRSVRRTDDPAVTDVDVEAFGGSVIRAAVEQLPADTAARLTCRAAEEKHPARFRLREPLRVVLRDRAVDTPVSGPDPA